MTEGSGGVAGYYRAFLGGLDPVDTAAARRRLAALDVPALVRWCRDAAVRDERGALVRAVLADSYTHANGFARISFPALATPVRLRLHIWPGCPPAPQAAPPDPVGPADPASPADPADPADPAGAADPAGPATPAGPADPDAHDHKWPFASRILAGALRNDLLRPIPASAGGYACLRHERAGTGYRLTPAGRAGLEPAGAAWSATGETYALEHTTVHRVWVDPGRYVATVVAELAPLTAVTSVFVPAGGAGAAAPRLVVPPRYTAAQLRWWLDGLARAMGTRP